MQLSLDAVGHHFPGGHHLFSDLTLTLVPETVYALTGPSGSGKSTLLGIMAGWITPTAGAVHRDGIRQVGRVFQNPHGTPGRNAVDHVALPILAAGHRRAEAHTKALGLLADFGLTSIADNPFRSLSGGEAQRLMLARAIAGSPDLLLVDEPTAQLDPQAAETITATLGALSREGMIVVVATHDHRAREACDVVIDLGSAA